MEIIKTAIRVGNSAGVLLPRELLGREVRVVLEPLNIEKEVLDILMNKEILNNIIGIYLIGSYARGEQMIGSDVDILVITDKINKRIKKGKYEMICISKEEIENQLEENALPILAMIKEAKIIINQDLIKNYLSSPLTEKNLRYHIETTKSAMNVVEKDLELSKEIKQEASDASAYSLILRLRTLYIIDCIKKGKMWSKKDFLKLVKNISGSVNAYGRYLSSKNKNTLECKLPIKEAEKLMDYINKKMVELERWLKERKG